MQGTVHSAEAQLEHEALQLEHEALQLEHEALPLLPLQRAATSTSWLARWPPKGLTWSATGRTWLHSGPPLGRGARALAARS
jgi:hypothetical protein